MSDAKPLSTIQHGPHIIERFAANRLHIRRVDGAEPTKPEAIAAAAWYWLNVGIRHTDETPNDPNPNAPAEQVNQ